MMQKLLKTLQFKSFELKNTNRYLIKQLTREMTKKPINVFKFITKSLLEKSNKLRCDSKFWVNICISYDKKNHADFILSVMKIAEQYR